ncbi:MULTISPECIES: hypothetical protein [Rubrivivax]|nr:MULTISPECIES: hypothetical protein [Rubrivivax]EGJ09439.1 hypothetical protein RBXJA2T_03888 [Rubrivivax benzoatilyticus JA2 = ATCC BAA-35]MCC9596762.1 hypothetical protein [Rubrivivax sp. JA1055]MCC9648919.1 hypothetical protein [Rubrivivax sp. JA1029]MCD0421080.1 hypothetical protein [Rubrivivax sp. JA1024]
MSTVFISRRRGRSADLSVSAAEAAARGVAAPACGWYESSLELMQGLAVTEHPGLDEFFHADLAEPSAAAAHPRGVGG